MRARSVRAAVAAFSTLMLLVLAVPASGVPGRAPVRTSPAGADRSVPPTTGTKTLPALSPAPDDALSKALATGDLTEAAYALERARTIFHRDGVAARYGSVAKVGPRDATLLLRDLAIRVRYLSPAQQRVARSILARPTDGGLDPGGQGYTTTEAAPYCNSVGCIHYVTSTVDAPSLVDANVNGVPDYVETALTTLNETWATEITSYGYRAPKSDVTSTNNGGSGLIDVYLAQVGDEGLYGYCTTDDPNLDPANGYAFWDLSAYCVVDNDFNSTEFPPTAATGIAALQVTMAHEFFHAVQYAYDAYEDSWWMEATSTWMEDEVYDAVNDNYQYLLDSPLSHPQLPIDRNNVFAKYGTFIFFRFLSEYYADPSIVHDAWVYADGSPVGQDDYSTQAIARAISDRGGKFRWLFADFAMYSDVPAAFYEEGASYPVPPLSKAYTITRTKYYVFNKAVMDHMSSRYVAFYPGNGIGTRDKLEVWLDLPRYKTGPEASIVTISTTGAVKYYVFALDRFGDGMLRVPFGKGKIAEVDLVLTNASTRFKCWVDTNYTYSCAGAPLDDNGTYYYEAYYV